jgi:hypothetical protein
LSTSAVEVTVNVIAGVAVGVGVGVGVAPGAFPLLRRPAEVECVVLNALAKLEASKSKEIDNRATTSVIRTAKARARLLFFILFFGVRFGMERAF